MRKAVIILISLAFIISSCGQATKEQTATISSSAGTKDTLIKLSKNYGILFPKYDEELELWYEPHIVDFRNSDTLKIKNLPCENGSELYINVSPDEKFVVIDHIIKGYVEMPEGRELYENYKCALIDIENAVSLDSWQSDCGGEWDESSNWIVAPIENENQEEFIYSQSNSNNYDPSGRIEGVFESNLGYREMKRSEIPDSAGLTGLFYENGKYYLRQAQISFSEGMSECTGDETLSLVSDAEFLFVNFKNYNKSEIQPVHLEKKPLLIPKNIDNSYVGEKFIFDFGNKQYELEAFGEKDSIRSSDINNYSVVYSIKGTANKQTIVNIPKTEDAVTQVLFIGDLDGDGHPDIILNAPDNYENHNIMVFLSSTAKKGNLLRGEAMKFDWFDC